jgi:hypothetical protein
LRLGSTVIHLVVNSQADAGVKEGLASAIHYAPEQLGDGFVYRHVFAPRDVATDFRTLTTASLPCWDATTILILPAWR